MTTLKQLHEATFQPGKEDATVNPSLLKTSTQEYQKKARSGVHKAQPIKMHDAGHAQPVQHAEPVKVQESRGHKVIANKLKTMELLRRGLKPVEPAKKEKDQFTPPEKK